LGRYTTEPIDFDDSRYNWLHMADALMFLPIFNQVEELPRVIDEIRREGPADVHFLLFDNGSTDGSSRLIAQSGFPTLRVERNRGIGHSYRIALDWARERRYVFFGTMAGNGKMLAREVPRLIEPLRSGVAHYVTGSRFLAGGSSPNLPGFRRWAIPAVNLFAWLMTGERLTDSTNGFRAYRLDLLSQPTLELSAPWMRTYGLEYYVYAKALMDKRVMCLEVPCTMRYPASGRYSKIRPGQDWYAMLRPWWRARFDGKSFGALPWA
jgi:dolichol-phosphate mannosyltransferase